MASPNDFLDVQRLSNTHNNNSNNITIDNNNGIETRISIPSLKSAVSQGRLAAPQPLEMMAELAGDPTGNGSRRGSVSKSRSSLRSRVSLRPNDPLGVRGSGSVYTGNVEEAASQWRTRLLHEKYLDGSTVIPKSPRKVTMNTLRSQQRLKQWNDAANGNPSETVVEEGMSEEEVTSGKREASFTAGDWINPVVDTSQVDPYLQALAPVSFHSGIFARELLVHLFQPLCLVLLPTKKGRVFLRNRAFIGTEFAVFTQWITACLLVVVHTLYFLEPANARIPFGEVLVMDLLFLVRITIIATKYGYTSRLEHEQMNEVVEHPLLKSDRQVITGWAAPSLELEQTQILLASVRQQIDLTVTYFETMQNHDDHFLSEGRQQPQQQQQQRHNQHNQQPLLQVPGQPTTAKHGISAQLQDQYAGFLTNKILETTPNHDVKVVPSHDVKPASKAVLRTVLISGDTKGDTTITLADGNPMAPKVTRTATTASTTASDNYSTLISAWDLAQSLLNNSHQIQYNGRLAFFFALFLSSIPMLVRVAQTRPYSGGTSPQSHIIQWSLFVNNFFLMVTNGAFLLIATMDTQRREFLQRRMNAILMDGFVIRPSEDPTKAATGSEEGLDIERFNMCKPRNLIAWFYLRVILQSFGMSYYKRINAYCGYFVVLGVVLVLLLLADVVGFFKGLMDLSSTIVTLVLVTFVLGTIIRTVYFGGRINTVRKEHAKVLILRKLEVESEMMYADGASEASILKQGSVCLDIVSNAVRVDNETFSVQILGFNASSDLMEALSGILLTGLVAAFRLIFQGDGSVLTGF